jgi:hypothetical protein
MSCDIYGTKSRKIHRNYPKARRQEILSDVLMLNIKRYNITWKKILINYEVLMLNIKRYNITWKKILIN